jgi:hypothetical protein
MLSALHEREFFRVAELGEMFGISHVTVLLNHTEHEAEVELPPTAELVLGETHCRRSGSHRFGTGSARYRSPSSRSRYSSPVISPRA